MKIEEFNIPVPWGHIAVKAWGNSSNKAVLVTHGRMDNAGSFDGLIPLMPKSFYYICIDLPSHGRSSHIPQFFPIRTIDFVIVYKLVLDYFKRGKYILLGHSYGAGIGQYFTRFYPEYVEKIINIDCIVIHDVDAKLFKDYVTRRFDALIAMYHKTQTGRKPTYSEEEIVEKIRNTRLNGPLTVENARSLTKRMLEPTGDGRYTLSTDQKMKVYMDPLHDLEYVMETLRLFPITCPVLTIVATKSPSILTDMQVALPVIKKWDKVKIVILDVEHDVHMTHPEIIIPYINEFLLTIDSKL